MRSLLLDHDEADALALVESLGTAGFEVTRAGSLHDAAHAPADFEAILVGTRGALEDRARDCRELRDGGYLGAVLVICVEASEGEVLLDAGADDFLTVPYEGLELSTRLRACVRRVAARSRLRWGPMDLDHAGRVLRLHGKTITLTNRECALLSFLIQAGGRVVTRAALRESVWHRKEDRGTNLVEVHLSRLRDKLGEDAAMIETVRRAGYRLRR